MNEYITETKISVNSCDAEGRIKPSAYFTLFQNAASLHADKLGVGYEELIKNDVIWMLVRCRYDVLCAPKFEQEVEVKTYPLPPRGIDFDREYVISDKSGKKLVIGTSKWCLCNYKTRKLIIRGKYGYNTQDFTEERQYDGGLKKIADFQTDGFNEFTAKTYFTDLDHNGHVNNTRYLDFILNAVHGDLSGDIKYLEIDYISEMKANADFTIYHKKIGNEFFGKCVSLGKEVFRAKLGLAD